MSLIIKRLRSLPINTRIHVSYGFMDGQTLAVTGTVIDKDDSAMEIRDDAGIPSFINFDTVRFFSIPAHETGADNRAVNAPVAQQNIIPEPPQAALPQKTLLCRKDVEQLTLGVSDQELKQVFDGLCREEKKLLQKAVDSFFYGVRYRGEADR